MREKPTIWTGHRVRGAWIAVLGAALGLVASPATAEDNADDTAGFGEIFLDVRATAAQRLADAEAALKDAPTFHDREAYEEPVAQWKQRLAEKLEDDEAEDGPVHRASNELHYALLHFEEGRASAPFRELEPAGDGTAEDPYQVDSIELLQVVDIKHDAHFVLTTDLDAAEAEAWNDGAGFEPIAREGTAFSGTLDGAGHTIANLTLDRPEEHNVALFAAADGTIRNLTLRDVTVSGRNYVAAVFARGGADVSNVRIESARITGDRRVGGVAGRPSRSRIERTAVVDGSIEARREVGGIVGRSTSSTSIYKSYARIRVEGDRDVGGIVGHTSGVASTFEQIYAAGEVVGERSVGGIAGAAGRREDSVEAAYWNREATGQEESALGEPLTSSQMHGEAAVSHMEGFDFDETWQIVDDGPPTLRE